MATSSMTAATTSDLLAGSEVAAEQVRAPREQQQTTATSLSARSAPPSTPDKFPDGKQMFGSIIDIIVGEGIGARTVKVHKGVLCYYSGYFKSALNGSFSEARDGVVKLPTVEPDTFELFTLWLYSRRLINPTGKDDITQLDQFTLVKLWIFADAHHIPLLQNKAVNMLHKRVVHEWAERKGSSGLLQHIYNNTTEEAKLRKFYIDFMAKTYAVSNALSVIDSWPKQALVDVLKVMSGMAFRCESIQEFSNWNLCEYHVHEEGVRCKKDDKRANR